MYSGNFVCYLVFVGDVFFIHSGSSCPKMTKVFMQIECTAGLSQKFQLPANIGGKERLQRGCTDIFLFKIPGFTCNYRCYFLHFN